MFKISSDLQETMLQSISTAMSGNMVMKIYGGTVPANAHDSLGGATLLRTVSNNGAGTGLSFESATVGGMLVKSTSETWKGTNVATGTATFYRMVLLTDDGSADTTVPRLQGSVGVLDADLILGDTALVSGVEDPAIGIYRVGLPLE